MPELSVEDWARVSGDELTAMDEISLDEKGGSRRWNRHVDRMQRAQLVLRATEAGRAAITRVIDNPIHTVAQWSAAHALFWAPEKARRFLEAETTAPGLDGFNAQMTLREFDAGRLRTDWMPKGRNPERAVRGMTVHSNVRSCLHRYALHG
jgi:hypothetical protein